MIVTIEWRSLLAATACSLALSGCPSADAPEPSAALRVAPGKTVSLEYTLRLENDEVVDSNVGSKPLVYTHGNGEMVPGLESALDGMTVDERKHVVVQPRDGYGLVDPGNVQEVPIFLVAPDAREPGAQIQTRGPHGEALYMRVKEVKGDTLLVDMNHPLAGEVLVFDVRILAIE